MVSYLSSYIVWWGEIDSNAKFLLTLTYKKTATKIRILVAIVLLNKQLPKYRYQ
jgi:hypothetical protein